MTWLNNKMDFKFNFADIFIFGKFLAYSEVEQCYIHSRITNVK